jgi:hypothetical protein
MSRKRDQISVGLDAETREQLEVVAAKERRTLAGQIRHI